MNVASACNAAALDAITALLNGGRFVLMDNSTELASLPLQTSGGAFGAATSATPAVATANAIGNDTSITVNSVISAFALRNSSNALRIDGTVGTSGADLILASVNIPAVATEVSCSNLQLSLSIT